MIFMHPRTSTYSSSFYVPLGWIYLIAPTVSRARIHTISNILSSSPLFFLYIFMHTSSLAVDYFFLSTEQMYLYEMDGWRTNHRKRGDRVGRVVVGKKMEDA